jgi:hypothetical protein
VSSRTCIPRKELTQVELREEVSKNEKWVNVLINSELFVHLLHSDTIMSGYRFHLLAPFLRAKKDH